MKSLLILVLVAAGYSSYAQSADTLEYYLESEGKTCQPNQGLYFRRAWKEGDWWRAKDYYMSTNALKSNVVYAVHEHKKDTFYTEQGMCYYYHANGTIKKKVRYIDGISEGFIKEYDTIGRLVDSGLYKKGIPYKARCKWNDKGAVVFKGIYDETGTGIGEEWEYHDDGKLAGYGKTGKLHLKDSVWTYYHENGVVSSIERYEADSLKDIQCFGEDGKPSADSCFALKMPDAGYDVSAFLASKMEYPTEANLREIQGTVYVSFVVNEEGKIINVRPIGAKVPGGCEEEALRVVYKLPKWRPGKYHNRPVKVYMNLPVSFRLE